MDATRDVDFLLESRVITSMSELSHGKEVTPSAVRDIALDMTKPSVSKHNLGPPVVPSYQLFGGEFAYYAY